MIKKVLLALIVLLVVLQFVPIDKNEAETLEITSFVADTKPNEKVLKILSSNCLDCHANKTTYPWYADIAPFSLWINHHVEEGKEHLNFSAWSNYNSKRRAHKLEELVEEIEKGEMPLKSYEILHGDLSDADAEVLVNWAKSTIANY